MSTTFTLHVFALQFWWLLDLCGSEGRIGDGSDFPLASHLRMQFAPLCFFSLLLFHYSSRRYVSHLSTRSLTLSALADGITIPGLSCDVAATPDLGAQRSTERFLSM